MGQALICIFFLIIGYHRVPWSLVCGNSKQSDTEIEVMHALIHDTFRASLHTKKILAAVWIGVWNCILVCRHGCRFCSLNIWLGQDSGCVTKARGLKLGPCGSQEGQFSRLPFRTWTVTLCVQTNDAQNGFQSFLPAVAFSSLWGAIAHGFLPTSCYSIPPLLSKHAHPVYVWFRGRCLFLAHSWVEQVTLPNSSHEGGEGKRDNNTSCKHSQRRD